MLALVAAVLLAGCRSSQDYSNASSDGVDLNAALARASDLKQPLVVLVADPGQSQADEDAAALLNSRAVKVASADTVTVLLDISISRNRATATRFHVVQTPLLLCLSSKGIIVSRDEQQVWRNLILKRIEQLKKEGPQLDAQFEALTDAAARNTSDTAAQFALMDFLVAHQNAVEAISPLSAIAHSEANAPTVRVYAWVALVRAHFWIAEPEKGRHEAEALIATLGPDNAEARAGGELVLGIQDATAKRVALARQEFESAIAAAPESSYGKQAAEALANLPKGAP